MFNKELKGKLNVISNLSKKLNKKRANVLYIIDHLQEKSLFVLINLLQKHGKYSKEKLKALKYRKRNIFP